MKTITFYSYKGGVGRSLALANVAKRLIEFNRKVCLLDFDLEAPGLELKFSERDFKISKGIVDYIYEFNNKLKVPSKIIDYSISFPIIPKKSNITFIPAGNIDSNDYWKKLSSINWNNMLYNNPNGLAFLLDLKEKIEKEFNPDYLLIDSRTGVSEMSGITTSILADELIIIAANNRENLKGVKKIIKNLSNPDNSVFEKPPKIFFVLSRIPFTNRQEDKVKEQILLERVKKEFNDIYTDEILVLHSDRNLEEKEELKIDSSFKVEENLSLITKDYLKLFEVITRNDLTDEEIKKFYAVKEAARLYQLARRSDDSKLKIDFINQAIELDKENLDYIRFRGEVYLDAGNYKEAKENFDYILKLDDNDLSAKLNLGIVFHHLKQYKKSLDIFFFILKSSNFFNKEGIYNMIGITFHHLNEREKAKEYFLKSIETNPSFYAYNSMGNLLREEKKFDEASQYIYKALQINPTFYLALATLAEIKAEQNKYDEFYLNLEFALMQDTKKQLEEAIRTEDIYKRFYSEPRFIKLLEKYNISLALSNEIETG